MVKMHANGITITVAEAQVDFFMRAGYEIVELEAAPEPEPEETLEPEPEPEHEGKE